MRRKPSAALGALRKASGETSDFLSSLSTVSEKLSQRTTEALLGTFGGAIGAIGGYSFDLIYDPSHPELPIVFASALGLLSALLLWRGPSSMLRERRFRAEEREFNQRIDFRSAAIKKLGSKPDPLMIERLNDYVLTGNLLEFQRNTIDISPNASNNAIANSNQAPPLISDGSSNKTV